ncbi:MAG: M3 family oligoendopeptidase [Deltaproteobacteria bacterium]|nr:M3 family oligoendopeptidase [Deltaproteobacteria bacterium]
MKNLQRYPTRFFHDFQEKLQPGHLDQWFPKLITQCEKAQTDSDWENIVMEWNETKCHVETHIELASLAFNRNTQDTAAEAEEKRLRETIEPNYKQYCATLRQHILNSKSRKHLEEKFGSQYFIQLQLQEDAFNPDNIAIETKLNEILSEYTKLTGSAEYEVQGQKYPLSHHRKFICSPDVNIRKESLKNFSAWYLQNQQSLESIYDRCVSLRTDMGIKLGKPNFIPLAYQKMRRTDYGPTEVARFREQIREVVVPLAQKIRERQAQSLQQPTLQAHNTEFFPEWQVKKIKVGVDGQVAAGLEVFQKLSPKLGAHFQKIIDCDLIDVPARTGKAPGAFCTDFGDYRVPFIFLNSVGEVSDISTLLHESGHAFQAWESRHLDLMELRWPTLEACEVHSMGMEFLAYPYYETFFSSEDAARFRKYHVAESLLLLPYIAMVDEFQHLVYSGQASNAKERSAIWEQLENTYLPNIDYTGLESWKPIRWLRQLHIFKYPFYYIDYAIALTGALQLWIQSNKDAKSALENYHQLCALGGTLPLQAFFKAGNLKIPFESGVLKEIVDEVLRIEPLW